MNDVGSKITINTFSDPIEMQPSENDKPQGGSLRGKDEVLKEITLNVSQNSPETIQKVKEIKKKRLVDSTTNSPEPNLIGIKSQESFSPGIQTLNDSPKKEDEKPLYLSETGVTFKFDSQNDGEKMIFEALKQLENSSNTQMQSSENPKLEEILLGDDKKDTSPMKYDVEQIKTVINLIIFFHKSYPDFDWSSEEQKNACKFLFQQNGSFIFRWKNDDSKEGALIPLRHGLFVYILLCRKLGTKPSYVMEPGKGAWKYLEIVREMVKIDGRYLKRAWDPLKNLPELVSIALKDSGLNLQYASKQLRNDLDTVLEALKYNPLAIEFASDEMKSNEKIISKALEMDPRTLKFIPQELQTKEMVIAAVMKNGRVLEFAKNFQGDKVIVTEAIKQDGFALDFASDELKEDTEVVDLAYKQNHRSFRSSSPKLKADEKYMEPKVREFPELIEFASDVLKDKKEFVEIATAKNPKLIKHASARVRREVQLKGCCEII